MYKSVIRDIYGFSQTTFHKLWNVRYFKELEAVGYVKTDKQVPIKVFEKFKEIWGEA